VVFAVDTHLLWQVIWVSFAAGLGIAVLFSLVILGSARAADARREGGTAAGWILLAVLAFLLFAAGVGLGVQEMITKD
jgi:hypothetical membrane protein